METQFNKLKEEILNKQGNLLYTTLSEECGELIQVCSKIIRAKFTNQELSRDNIDNVQNLLEEIGDVKLNLELIKDQIAKDCSISRTEVDDDIWSWQKEKYEKLLKIFLK